VRVIASSPDVNNAQMRLLFVAEPPGAELLAERAAR
jgi:hypothetical protein